MRSVPCTVIIAKDDDRVWSLFEARIDMTLLDRISAKVVKVP